MESLHCIGTVQQIFFEPLMRICLGPGFVCYFDCSLWSIYNMCKFWRTVNYCCQYLMITVPSLNSMLLWKRKVISSKTSAWSLMRLFLFLFYSLLRSFLSFNILRAVLLLFLVLLCHIRHSHIIKRSGIIRRVTCHDSSIFVYCALVFINGMQTNGPMFYGTIRIFPTFVYEYYQF